MDHMLEENSFKVVKSLEQSSFIAIAVNAVKDRLHAINACCVQLQDGQYMIGAVEPNEKNLHLFIPCNSPGSPSTVYWTADHLVNKILPEPSKYRTLINTIREKLHLRSDENSPRFFLVFFDADCRPLFVSAHRGIIDAGEFDKEISKRNQSVAPTFSQFPADDSDWLHESVNSANDAAWI
ncbi:unnamed protein product [Rodentolepis nana]|uniref:Robl_LC7 domain-containing protein n=1 Tax=Rodentolepis nana TaxID=102285 RepID=A0A0R3TCF2_RODNA|nr:unnamed protein product [Rodentolepis nana]